MKEINLKQSVCCSWDCGPDQDPVQHQLMSLFHCRKQIQSLFRYPAASILSFLILMFLHIPLLSHSARMHYLKQIVVPSLSITQNISTFSSLIHWTTESSYFLSPSAPLPLAGSDHTVVTESRGLYIFFPSGDLEPWASSSWMVIQLSRIRRFLFFMIFFWLSNRMLLPGGWSWDERGSSAPPADDERSLSPRR